MSTFTAYEVRSEQSGRLLYPVNPGLDAADLATCKTKATSLASQYPYDQLCVVPAGYSVNSDRPLTIPPPAAGQLPVIASYT